MFGTILQPAARALSSLKSSFRGNAFLAAALVLAICLIGCMLWQYYKEWQFDRAFARFRASKQLKPGMTSPIQPETRRLTAVQVDMRRRLQRTETKRGPIGQPAGTRTAGALSNPSPEKAIPELIEM
jgi:hypothetical protein